MNKTWRIHWRKRKLDAVTVTAHRMLANPDDGLVIFLNNENYVKAVVNADEVRWIELYVDQTP